MTAREVPVVTLNEGREMPLIGFGTYKIVGADAERAVREAIEAGYRHFDTATLYQNEEEVGRALRAAIAAGDVTREELFVTTKVWQDGQGAERLPEAFTASLRRLGLDFVDCYLIHWPWPQGGLYNETFEAMARIQGFGHIQNIGVANFNERLLTDLVETTGIVPVLNQVECHVGFTQPSLRELHKKYGVVTEAWAPLGRGRPLTDPDLKAIAARKGATEAQVALRFLHQLGVSVVPKTTSAARMAENMGMLDFRLNRDDMEVLLPKDTAAGFGRYSGDPEEFPGETGY